MDEITRTNRAHLWAQDEGLVETWDFSRANETRETRWETIKCLLGERRKMAHLLLENPDEARRIGFPSEVLEFIRFGGDMDIEHSLRHNPNLPFLHSLGSQEREGDVRRHREMVATFRLIIPSFVYRDIQAINAGVSLYYPPLLGEQSSFWEPDKGLTMHFIFADENRRQWRTFQKLKRLGIPQKEAETVLGTNILREVWLQGHHESLHCLFGVTDFKHLQTEELIRKMHSMVQKRQPSFTRVKEPSLFVH